MIIGLNLCSSLPIDEIIPFLKLKGISNEMNQNDQLTRRTKNEPMTPKIDPYNRLKEISSIPNKNIAGMINQKHT